MNDESRSDGVMIVAGVLMSVFLFGGAGAVWLLWSKQQIAREQAMQAEQRAMAEASLARAKAELARIESVLDEHRAESRAFSEIEYSKSTDLADEAAAAADDVATEAIEPPID